MYTALKMYIISCEVLFTLKFVYFSQWSLHCSYLIKVAGYVCLVFSYNQCMTTHID